MNRNTALSLQPRSNKLHTDDAHDEMLRQDSSLSLGLQIVFYAGKMFAGQNKNLVYRRQKACGATLLVPYYF